MFEKLLKSVTFSFIASFIAVSPAHAQEESGSKFLKRELVCTHVDGAKYNINFRPQGVFLTTRAPSASDYSQEKLIKRNDFEGAEWITLNYGESFRVEYDGRAALYRVDNVSDNEIIFSYSFVQFGRGSQDLDSQVAREYEVRVGVTPSNRMTIGCGSNLYSLAASNRLGAPITQPKRCGDFMRGNGVYFPPQNVRLSCRLH